MLLALFIPKITNAQVNLIPNPNFENYTSCPLENELGQGEFNKCVGWWYPTPMSIGTPDYFNVCNDSIGNNQGFVSIPNNFWGYQPAFNGNGYVGSVMFDYSLFTEKIVGTEPIECKLNSPLKSCIIYSFSAMVNLANYSSHGITRIGIALTKTPLKIDSLEANFAISPAWENTIALSDTVNWVKIGGTFTAKGGENYLTIGYFHNYTPEELVFIGDTVINFFNDYFGYYYIDSVSLTEVGADENCTPQLPNVFTPNNDGVNDVFNIADWGVEQLDIYNRWGTKISSLTPENPIWNGTCNNQACSEGVYYYVGKYNGINLKGAIQLIR